ncbi:MAG: hypothetical protein R3C42_03270 [Parvularculaceae bacterium]
MRTVAGGGAGGPSSAAAFAVLSSKPATKAPPEAIARTSAAPAMYRPGRLMEILRIAKFLIPQAEE